MALARSGTRLRVRPAYSICLQFVELLKKSPLGRLRRPGREIVLLDRSRQGRARAEKSPRLRRTEAREHRRLQECGAAVGGLDGGRDLSRQIVRQSEPEMNRLEQAVFDGLVGAADHDLERRDHVTDDVFGRIVEQQRKPKLAIASAVAKARDLLRQQGM